MWSILINIFTGIGIITSFIIICYYINNLYLYIIDYLDKVKSAKYHPIFIEEVKSQWQKGDQLDNGDIFQRFEEEDVFGTKNVICCTDPYDNDHPSWIYVNDKRIGFLKDLNVSLKERLAENGKDKETAAGV